MKLLLRSAVSVIGAVLILVSTGYSAELTTQRDTGIIAEDGESAADPGCCGMYTGGMTGNTDYDMNGSIDIGDIVRLADRIWMTHTALDCEENGNVDGDFEGKLNLGDMIRLVNSVRVPPYDPTEPCQ